jgi:two-component system CheB/CheR fusion protein
VPSTPTADPEFEGLLGYIKDARGFDFTGYKRPSLRRLFDKRLQAVRMDGYAAYQDYLEANPDEFYELFNTILINVTGFFRDQQAWDFLAGDVIPKIAETKEDIRVWTPGCASGEEAYTVAMLFAERMGVDAFKARVKVYATDLDEDALREGRHAVYPSKKLAALDPELLQKYFARNTTGYQFKPELRRTVVFGRHDLVRDPPISRVDLLVCRNTLMYFNVETQRRILTNFNFALRDDGFLFLGKSEVLMTRTNLFRPYELRRRIFVKAKGDGGGRLLARTERAEEERDPAIEDAAFEAAPTAQVVVDRAGKLVRANSQARRLFGLTNRNRGRAITELELAYRPLELGARIEQAYTRGRAVTARDVEWNLGEEPRYFDVQIVPLSLLNTNPVGVSVTFTDVSRYKALEASLEVARRDAEAAYETLQSTFEELETTNEELQSTNEELETTNEELQSTNEELETMNEELQSTNEELETMNDELQVSTDDLNQTNAFLESVLASLKAGVAVVDRELKILAWNDAAQDLWGVRAGEAAGAHLLNLDIGLPVDRLRGPLRKIFRGNEPSVEFTLEARNRRGRDITVRVTATPIVTGDDVTGAIIAMDALDR